MKFFFLQYIYAQNTFFVLAKGGGVNFNISSNFYFHFVIKYGVEFRIIYLVMLTAKCSSHLVDNLHRYSNAV